MRADLKEILAILKPEVITIDPSSSSEAELEDPQFPDTQTPSEADTVLLSSESSEHPPYSPLTDHE
jgi:hypothetical protein